MERWVEGLCIESFCVEVVADYTEGEDGECKEVAAIKRGAEDAG